MAGYYQPDVYALIAARQYNPQLLAYQRALAVGQGITGELQGLGDDMLRQKMLRQQLQEQSATDAAANDLVNQQYAPRAQAVGPDAAKVQAAADQSAASMTPTLSGFGGGVKGAMDIVDLQNAMAKQKQYGMGLQLDRDRLNQEIAYQNGQLGLEGTRINNESQAHRDLMAEERARTVATQQDAMARIEQARAAQASRLQTQDAQNAMKNSLAYFSQLRAAQTAYSQALAKNQPDAANAALDTINSIYTTARSNGLKVDEPAIITQQRAQLSAQLQDAQSRLQGMKSDWIPDMFGGDAHQQARVDQLQAQLNALGASPSNQQIQIAPQQAAQVSQPTGQQQSAPSPAAASNAISQAKDAISKGADPKAVAARLQQLGIDPSALNQ